MPTPQTHPHPVSRRTRATHGAAFEPLEPRQLFSTTLLVDFDGATGPGSPVTATAADFALAAPGIDLAAPVQTVGATGIDNPILGTNGLTANIAHSTNNNAFQTDKGTFADTPILDDYLATNSSRSVTLSGLDEIDTGSLINLTLWGVGDAPGQDTRFTVTYNGDTLGPVDTDYDAGTIQAATATVQLIKATGIDSLTITFTNEISSRSGGLGGFSLTVVDSTEPTAIRINAGGDTHTDSQGNTFLADTFSVGGRTFAVTDDIFIPGTGSTTANDQDADDILYQTERFGTNFSYEIPAADGFYTLRLHYAEIFFDEPNQRIFDVEAEGTLISNDLDVFEARQNAFTPGDFSALIQEFNLIEITDGSLSLNLESQGTDGANNAKISAIELIPLTDSFLALLTSDGGTSVTEGGTTDTYQLVLTQAPTDDVTVTVDLGTELSADITSITFTPDNFDTPQTITLSAVDDQAPEGTQTLTLLHTLTSPDPSFDNTTASLNVVVQDNDISIPVAFRQSTIASNFPRPTTGTFGPDGRLYVANQEGLIQAYTLDGDNNVIATQTIDTIANQPSFNNVLGIAFNPFEDLSGGQSPTLYLSRSALFLGTNTFGSRVSTLSGPNFTTVTDIVTGLPVSGFDHGINGLQFDGNGDLLIAVGGNTNTGEFDGVFGSQAPESPLTSAILRARITDPNFNGNIQYEFIDPNDPNIPNPDAGPNDQRNGNFVRVVDGPGVEVETFAVGLRNPYDIVFTTDGQLFSTDNGPNGIAMDELNQIVEGGFFGHPSIPRSANGDPRQSLSNAEYDPNADNPNVINPLTALNSSTNGIDEIRSEVFDGLLRGQLIAQDFNGDVFFFQRTADGQGLANTNVRTDVADGLDILTGPGGVIFGIDRNQNRITVARPVDDTVTAPTPYDIFPFRAPAVGGNTFTIGGVNFGTLADTTVLIGGVEATVTAIEDGRIVGLFPPISGTEGFLDVTVTTGGVTSVIEGAFLPLGEGPAVDATVEGRFVFYNNSAFDGNDNAANASDDNAIANDKQALLPGQTATFANYTSFSRGLNGIFVDIANLPGTLSDADFALSVGNGSSLSDFTPLDTAATVTVRTGAGINGSDRVTLTLPDNAVTGQYLQITVLANANTGLAQDDVFYFGNAVGDSGNVTANAQVNATDEIGARNNPHNFLNFAAVDDLYDYNRDRLVNATDQIIARNNTTNFLSDLNLITAPVPAPAAEDLDISLATVTTPTAQQSVVSLATVTAPAAQQPVVNLATVTTPAAQQPVVNLATDTTPGEEQPIVSLATDTTPAAQQSVVSLAPVTAPAAQQPAASLATVTTPTAQQPVVNIATVTTPTAQQPVVSLAAVTTPTAQQPAVNIATVTAPAAQQPVVRLAALFEQIDIQVVAPPTPTPNVIDFSLATVPAPNDIGQARQLQAIASYVQWQQFLEAQTNNQDDDDQAALVDA